VRPHLQVGDALLFDCRFVNAISYLKKRYSDDKVRFEPFDCDVNSLEFDRCNPESHLSSNRCRQYIIREDNGLCADNRYYDTQSIFDGFSLLISRLLHFGLANKCFANDTKDGKATLELCEGCGGRVRNCGCDGWRALIYINYHHQWFHDPKNWNENDKLFSDSSS
jgi:hypothetical protein